MEGPEGRHQVAQRERPGGGQVDVRNVVRLALAHHLGGPYRRVHRAHFERHPRPAAANHLAQCLRCVLHRDPLAAQQPADGFNHGDHGAASASGSFSRYDFVTRAPIRLASFSSGRS